MKPVITFAIPLAPKCRADAYWDKAMDNLNRTLRSLENQTSDAYNVILCRNSVYFWDDFRFDQSYRNMIKTKIFTIQ